MNKLADQGALDLTQLKLVFLDTHTDKKNLSLLTLKDVQVSIDMRTRRSAFVSLPIHVSNGSGRPQQDLWSLYGSHVLGRVKSGHAKLVLMT